MKIICSIIAMSLTTLLMNAQPKSDTLTTEIRRYTARNFSQSRTLNLYWEATSNHNYTFKQNGQKTEEGRVSDKHTIRFNTTFPILLHKKFSIYANGQFNFYKFKTTNNETGAASYIFSEESGYNYYKGGVSGTYRTKIGYIPVMLSAGISGDGWRGGFGKIQGSLSAIVILKYSSKSSISAGIICMTLFNKIPVIPFITYSYQFNTDWSIDIAFPQLFLRYQFCNDQRFSIGTSMDGEQFYLKPGIAELPEVCFYKKISIKPEIIYEYIINKNFYLIARAGGSINIRSGLYNTNRKGAGWKPYVKFTAPVTPFFYLGFSYNLFK